MTNKTVIWWLRRDLRLTDNQALTAALRSASTVIPAYILDEHLLSANANAEKRLDFLFSGLHIIDNDLRQLGSRLVIRRGNPVEALEMLCQEANAAEIFAEEDYSPYARRRDSDVAKQIILHLEPGLTIHHPHQVRKPGGEPYSVFTPFMRAWKEKPTPRFVDVLPAPQRLPPVPEINSEELPGIVLHGDRKTFPAGEQEAHARLQNFVDGSTPLIFQYKEMRDRPDLNRTSGLSPYLRFGMLSIRQAVLAARASLLEARTTAAEQNAESWLNELIWREFYFSILYNFPTVLRQSFRSNLRGIGWSNDVEMFSAWKDGQTGFPFVDAGMRQLRQTGWMHNRLRMVVASFLVKNLLIDWRWGEHWFMQQLIDGDPAANNGGWQWTAGTGTDAAPYFRIFNPVIQGKKFDPLGEYIRRWVPELALIPDAYIHEPWTMPALLQRKIGLLIGVNYPDPIVDLGWSRQRALTTFQKANEEFKNTQQANYDYA